MATASKQLAAFIDRILRMKEEADGLAEDIRAIYAEAKSEGFDKTQLGKVVNYLRQKNKDGGKVEEAEAIFDLYLGDYLAAKQMAPHVRAHTHTREEDDTDSEASLDAWAEKMADRIDPQLLLTIIEGSQTEAGRKIIMGAIEQVRGGDKVAALRANPAMAIVGAADLKKSEQPSNMQKVHIAPAETQSAPQAGRDLTTPAPLNGQVASNQLETANETTAARKDVRDNSTGNGTGKPGTDPAAAITLPAGTQAPPVDKAADKPVEASASAAPLPIKYAAPGVITWEVAPPEGVQRHDFSAAFGDLGQDLVVIGDEIASARAEPIVKIGNVILDGWARYMVARGAIGLDGHSTEYSVVQYDGADPLMDCIKWNLAGRILNETQKRLIAQRLAKLQPKRKNDIYAAMDMGMELVS